MIVMPRVRAGRSRRYAEPPRLGPSSRVMIIRHAEKPEGQAADRAVDGRGEEDAAALTVAGWQRVGVIAALFASAPAGTSQLLSRPRTIHAAADTPRSRRPRLTIEPLARALGIEPVMTAEDDPAAITLAASGQTPLLLCWRHRAIPPLAEAIAGTGKAPAEWPSERYDLVWVLDRYPDGWSFSELSQDRLMVSPATTETGG